MTTWIQELIVNKYAPMLEQYAWEAIKYSVDLFHRVVMFELVSNALWAILWIIMVVLWQRFIRIAYKESAKDWRERREWIEIMWYLAWWIFLFIWLFLAISCVYDVIKLSIIPEVYVFNSLIK